MNHEKTTDNLTAFLTKFKAPILGSISLVSGIYGFSKLFIEQDTGLLTCITLTVGALCFLLTCLYFALYWKPESQDTDSLIILPLNSDELIKSQKKKEKERRVRKVIRCLSFIGLIVIPILIIFGFNRWQYVQNLPSNDVTILVADFDGPDPMNYRVSEKIRENLKNGTTSYSNVKIKALNKIIKESEKDKDGSEVAHEEGRKHKATIVIWGWYGKTKNVVPIRAHFELLKWPNLSYVPNSSLPLPIDLTTKSLLVPIAQLESTTIHTHLSKEMTYLTLLTLGISHSLVEEWEDAIEKFTKALEQMQNVGNEISFLTKSKVLTFRGNARIHGDLTGALSDVNEAIKIDPDNTAAYSLRGLVRILQTKEKGGLADINKAIKLAPNDSTLYLARGTIRNDYLRDDKGIEDVNKSIKLNPNKSDSYAVRGSIRTEMGDIRGGMSDFDKAIKLNPNNYLIYSQRGSYRCLKGEIKRGIADLTKAIQLNNKSSSTYFLRGTNQIMWGDAKEGIADLSKVIQLKPKDDGAYAARGSYRIQLGNKKEGLDDIAKALRLNPQNILAYLSRGNYRIQLGNEKEGIDDLKRSIHLLSQDIKHNSMNALAYTQRGAIQVQLGYNKEAINDLTKAIQLNRNNYLNYSSFSSRGIAHLNLSDFKSAISDFNKAISLEPDYSSAYIARALAYQSQKNYKKALIDYKYSLENKWNPSFLVNKVILASKTVITKNIGLMNYEIGIKDEALKQFLIAYREDSEDAELNFALAIALYSKGERQKSYELAKDALSSEKRYSNITFLRQKLWGEELIGDAKILLAEPKMKALIQ
jgi:tetratricopeptide (TPR) repeat protein